MQQISSAVIGVDSADDVLAKKVRLFLSANRHGFPWIHVEAATGTVRLSGDVASSFLHRMALAMAKSVAGVRHVVDRLEVRPPPYAESPIRRTGCELAAAS